MRARLLPVLLGLAGCQYPDRLDDVGEACVVVDEAVWGSPDASELDLEVHVTLDECLPCDDRIVTTECRASYEAEGDLVMIEASAEVERHGNPGPLRYIGCSGGCRTAAATCAWPYVPSDGEPRLLGLAYGEGYERVFHPFDVATHLDACVSSE
jgi:hypothetical protein